MLFRSDIDTDGDGLHDGLDSDDDGDGIGDDNDAFPLDSSEDTDTDGDGTGDNADTDDDGDGTADSDDWAPLDDSEDTDTDGDGALYAASILGTTDKKIKNSLLKLRIKQTKSVKKKPK